MSARVLIADDDAVVRDVVRRYLERDGLEVRVAGDGNEALRVLSSERIDVAVLDVMMPGPNGLSLCRTLRQGGDYTVPVILLTALSEEDDRIAGLEAGADDYLTKPFGLEELVARIRVALRRVDGPRENHLVTTDAFSLDVDARRATVRGEAVRLTPTEWRLVETLARRPGTKVSSKELLGQVWGPDSLGRTHYLRVYFGHLRRKLEDDPANPRHFITVAGEGYRFDP